MRTQSKVLTVSFLKQIIGDKNKIFNVTFVKRDGTLRSFNAIRCSAKALKGGDLKYSPEKHRLITCFAMDELEWKSFSIDRVVRIKANRVELNFDVA